MKKFICIFVILLALFMLCSCLTKKKGLRNNLKTVDMSKFSKNVTAPSTDNRVDSDNNSNNNTNKSTTPVSDASTPNGMTINESGSKSGNSGSNTGANSENKEVSPGGKTGNKPTGEGKETFSESESQIRDNDAPMQTEKYLIYLPTIIEQITAIDRTDYGATVHFYSTTDERFEKYVTELRSMGFVQDMSLSESSFSAHTKSGMYVKFIVTPQESWLAIYDDAKHLG